jgi:hypothetical protein
MGMSIVSLVQLSQDDSMYEMPLPLVLCLLMSRCLHLSYESLQSYALQGDLATPCALC